MQNGWINRMLRAPDWLRGKLHVAVLRAGGAKIGRHCFIRDIEVPCDPWDLLIEDGVGLDNRVVLCLNGPSRGAPKIVIRAGAYINRYTVIDAFEKVEVGAGSMIGPHCYIGDHDHQRVPGLSGINSPLQGAAIRIGRRVWIGAGTVITKGVTIGDDATVGAGSVVRHDVAPGSVVAGVPARPVAQRLRATA